LRVEDEGIEMLRSPKVIAIEQGDPVTNRGLDAGVAGRPRFSSCRRKRTLWVTVEAKVETISSVPSREPSSTTISSQCGYVWAATEASVSAR